MSFVKRWVQIGLDYGIISEKNIEKLLESAYGQPPRAEDIAGFPYRTHSASKNTFRSFM